jgi:hypothetical protein
MMSDPVEDEVQTILTDLGVQFQRDVRDLDFWLPKHSLYIECKRFFTPRVVGQMTRAENVVVVQGLGTFSVLAEMFAPTCKPDTRRLQARSKEDE